MPETPKYRLDSPTQAWVREINGNTKQELAQTAANRAGLIPDNAIIIDADGKQVGQWIPTDTHGYVSPKLMGRAGLQFRDNRPGQEYLWIADRSEAVCVAGEISA